MYFPKILTTSSTKSKAVNLDQRFEFQNSICWYVDESVTGESAKVVAPKKELNRKRATVTGVIIGHQPKQYNIKGKSQFTIHLHQVWFSQKRVPFKEIPVSKPFQPIIQLWGKLFYFIIFVYTGLRPLKPREQIQSATWLCAIWSFLVDGFNPLKILVKLDHFRR